MKKIFLTLVLTIGIFTGMNVAQAQIKVITGGNVGIGLVSGANPNWKLDVNGSVGINGPMTVNGNILFRTNLTVNGDTKLGKIVPNPSYPNSALSFISYERYEGPYPDGPFPFKSDAALIPFSDATGYIGTAHNKLSTIYAYLICYNTLYQVSDKTMKTNIVPASRSKKSKLNSINVYTYDLSDKLYDSVKDEKARKIFKEKGKNQTGVMAQELLESYPELVRQDPETKLYAVNYVGFIPHLISAYQEQNRELDELKQENEAMKAEILSIRQNCCLATKPIITKQGTNENLNQETIVLSARLDQNKPNPFKEGTQISYFIPEKAQKAGIYVYDLNGKQVKQLPITEKGEGSLRINGQELTAGMYLYTLIIDNMPIDTKRMILTE